VDAAVTKWMRPSQSGCGRYKEGQKRVDAAVAKKTKKQARGCGRYKEGDAVRTAVRNGTGCAMRGVLLCPKP
jgi:hypothetical protein